MNNQEISEVKSTKFLGVIINNQLNWKNHLDYICTKIAKNIGIILKARHVFEKHTLLSLYYSLIYPYLTYCIQVWGATYQSRLSKLMILQKKIVRIIHGVPHRTHTEPLFLVLNVLKVSNLYKYNIALLCTNWIILCCLTYFLCLYIIMKFIEKPSTWRPCYHCTTPFYILIWVIAYMCGARHIILILMILSYYRTKLCA